MGKIRVVLADDHGLVRRGFQALLSHEPDIEVVGQAEDGREAMRLVDRERPDVLVMDLEMPGMMGIEAARQLAKRGSLVRVLILTMHNDLEHILQVLRAKAAGYVLKDGSVSDLVEGIRTVHRGEVYLSPAISTRVVMHLLERPIEDEYVSPLEALTDREREVLQLIAEGKSRKAIAEMMTISPKTVDAHRANLMRKLEAEDNAALVRLAIRHGIA
jgi:DNA-binding NarL/FixJ family response regulator